MNLKKYVGTKLYGYCNGYFGRDSYEEKQIVYAGENYIVCEYNDGWPCIAIFDNKSDKEIEALIEDWKINWKK